MKRKSVLNPYAKIQLPTKREKIYPSSKGIDPKGCFRYDRAEGAHLKAV